MNLKKRIFFICLVVASLSLGASLSLSRYPLLGLAVLVPVGGMYLAYKPKLGGLAHFALAGFSALAAAALLLEAPLLPLVVACSAALAAWDLTLESHQAGSHEGAFINPEYEKLHWKSLGLAIGLGLFGAGMGGLIRWQAPFLVVLVLILLALFCLDRALQYVIR